MMKREVSMKGSKCTARLSIFSLAFALGIVSGLCMLLFALYAYKYGHGIVLIAQWSEIYTGYAPTMKGAWIGAAWGFIDGFISGLIIAVIYNLCLCCCGAVCRSNEVCEVKVTKTTSKK